MKAAIAAGLPAGEPFYPPDAVADRPEKFFAAEFVREAVFNLYGEEIPYSTTVVIDEFTERPERKDYVLATIFVERESQKAIIIGSGGSALKRVGSQARREIEAFTGRPVYLEMRVKVAEAWRKDERFIRQYLRPRLGRHQRVCAGRWRGTGLCSCGWGRAISNEGSTTCVLWPFSRRFVNAGVLCGDLPFSCQTPASKPNRVGILVATRDAARFSFGRRPRTSRVPVLLCLYFPSQRRPLTLW